MPRRRRLDAARRGATSPSRVKKCERRRSSLVVVAVPFASTHSTQGASERDRDRERSSITARDIGLVASIQVEINSPVESGLLQRSRRFARFPWELRRSKGDHLLDRSMNVVDDTGDLVSRLTDRLLRVLVLWQELCVELRLLPAIVRQVPRQLRLIDTVRESRVSPGWVLQGRPRDHHVERCCSVFLKGQPRLWHLTVWTRGSFLTGEKRQWGSEEGRERENKRYSDPPVLCEDS